MVCIFLVLMTTQSTLQYSTFLPLTLMSLQCFCVLPFLHHTLLAAVRGLSILQGKMGINHLSMLKIRSVDQFLLIGDTRNHIRLIILYFDVNSLWCFIPYKLNLLHVTFFWWRIPSTRFFLTRYLWGSLLLSDWRVLEQRVHLWFRVKYNQIGLSRVTSK